MIVVLLIAHGLLAVALLGAITHQALSVLTIAPSANGRWTFVDRFRGVDATAAIAERYASTRTKRVASSRS
jgi:hypothetical protein